ncbi:hypothetical protein GTQ43_26735 [Nostoc sp. KVJ3]|uniref:hypothetical protein n=1 Tax=Nostoc sp. KVJ3 TaxID=457945 RepID=UPI00223706F4|nr:hypothetical protein [Nostoc sp. KVJ3]MCW5317270.1 hypothetical protein [Nostoc sp. KVJ3]
MILKAQQCCATPHPSSRALPAQRSGSPTCCVIHLPEKRCIRLIISASSQPTTKKLIAIALLAIICEAAQNQPRI